MNLKCRFSSNQFIPECLLVSDPLGLEDPVDGLPLVGHGHPQLAQHRERAHDVEVHAASRDHKWNLTDIKWTFSIFHNGI